MIFLINVVNRRDVELIQLTFSSRIWQIVNSHLISFVLIIIGSRSLKFYLRSPIIGRIINRSFVFKLIFWKIVFIAWCSIEWYLSPLICYLRNIFCLYFRGFNIMRLVRSNPLESHCRRLIKLSWLENIFILWILRRLYWIRFILIFIWCLAYKWNLIKYPTLR